MKIQNTLANRLDTAGTMLRYDESCKKVLSDKTLLAWIMKACAIEFQEQSIEDIAEKYIEGTPLVGGEAVHADETAEFVEGLNTEDATIREGTVAFDIKFKMILPDSHDNADMIINVETQNDFYPGYPIIKRGIYYAGRMISSQYGTVFVGSAYQKIKKVYSIWICPNAPKYRQNTIMRYAVKEEAVRGNVKEEESNYDLLTVVLICLGGKNQEGYQGVIKMLDILFSRESEAVEKKRILQDEFGISMTRELEDEVDIMCNLSKGIYEQGIERGIEQGRYATLVSLVRDGLLNISIAADKANLSIDEFNALMKKVVKMDKD